MDTLADNIKTLPVDKNPPSETEMRVINTLFKQEQREVSKFISKSKEVLLAGSLFILFSLPQTDPWVERFFPVCRDSEYLRIFIKAVFFMLAFFIIKNFYLIKKS